MWVVHLLGSGFYYSFFTCMRMMSTHRQVTNNINNKNNMVTTLWIYQLATINLKWVERKRGRRPSQVGPSSFLYILSKTYVYTRPEYAL